MELTELDRPNDADAGDAVEAGAKPSALEPGERWSLALLLLQHLSSTWGTRSFEFAAFLYISTLWPNTLLPASIFGFCTTGAAILFSGLIGNQVDATPRLRFVRWCIALQKLLVAFSYAVFLVLFLKLRRRTASSLSTGDALVWVLFTILVLLSAALNLSTIAITVAIERDWVTTIAGDNSEKLTILNANIRRIDLLSKLAAPLFVSLLTVTVSYPFSIAFMLGYSVVTLLTEFVWIKIVYRKWPVLGTEEEERMALQQESAGVQAPDGSKTSALSRVLSRVKPNARQQLTDWQEFVSSPVFPSSLAISLLYLTVLSFDGTMLTWLKSHAYQDSFLAGMRGICVVTGLVGTIAMPWLEKRIGLVRAGSWSIMSEVASLVPVLLSFFIGAARQGQRSAPWNAAMLFSGMALSRVGLWAFDLCQLKELQTTLRTHPRRNSLTALQYSLQNILHLLKYVLTLVVRRPDQFKWAALVSFTSVCAGAISYLFYVRQTRGHLVHLGWASERLALLRKQR